MTQDEFIARADKLWNGKFDYSLVEYVNLTTKIKLKCPIHGVFRQQASGHLYGKDCRKCARWLQKFHIHD